MKKLCSFIAIVFCAAIAQSAQITWGNDSSTPILDLTGANLTAAKASQYSMCFSLIDANGSLVVKTETIGGKKAGFLTGDVTRTYTYGTDFKNGDVFTIVGQITVDGQKYEMTVGEFTLTAMDNSGKDVFKWGDWVQVGEDPVTHEPIMEFQTGTYGGLTELGTAGTRRSWQPVPEPTSALLMLLGVAGMALKRKRV